MSFDPMLTRFRVVLLTASLERMISLRFPFYKRRYITVQKVVIVVVVCCIISTIPPTVHLTLVYGQRQLYRTYFVGTHVLIMTSLMCTYALLLLTYITIKRSLVNTATLQCHHPQHVRIAELSKRKKNTRLFHIFFLMCSAYAIGILPHTIYVMCVDYQNYTILDVVITEATGMLYYFSAFINPLATLAAKEDYRKTMLRLLRVFERKKGKNSFEQCSLANVAKVK